jgi:hypothetical protein
LWARAPSLPSPDSMRRSTSFLTGMFGGIIMQKLDTACDKNASSLVRSVSDRMGLVPPGDASNYWRGGGKKGNWCGVKSERKGEAAPLARQEWDFVQVSVPTIDTYLEPSVWVEYAFRSMPYSGQRRNPGFFQIVER